MMAEYEYLFAMAVQSKIKNRVKANVYVTILPSDELFVKIYKEGDFEFKTYRKHITEEINNGLSSDFIAYLIARDFKKFIMNMYF